MERPKWDVVRPGEYAWDERGGGKERGTVTLDLTEVYEGMDDPYINWSLIILPPIPHVPHEV